jgi:hypothetical protein
LARQTQEGLLEEDNVKRDKQANKDELQPRVRSQSDFSIEACRHFKLSEVTLEPSLLIG